MSLEIERKWLLPNGIPKRLGKYKPSHYIEQSYLYVSDDIEVRVRKKQNFNNDKFDYRQVIKLGNGMVRPEYDIYLSEIEYNKFMEDIMHKPITKDYYTFDFLGYSLEINKVDNSWWYAEIEFPSVEEADNFICPFADWEEVTGKPEYQMKNYWLQRQNKPN